MSTFRALTCIILSVCCLASAAEQGVKITKLNEKVRVEIGGRLFTEYHYADVPRPYCDPVIGPGEIQVTRDFPMRNTPGEELDHPHHRSLWFTHGAVNGQDFWTEQKDFGKIVHQKFTAVQSGRKEGKITSENNWVSAAGKTICTDTRTLRFYASTNPLVMDYTITLHAADEPLVLGDTKEGTMAIRLAETMRLKPNKFNAGKPTGHIVLSTGERDEATWGRRAAWCDYSGPVAGKTLGVAMFDHPSNPRFPTWWHVRDYGLFAANPFGQHEFEKLADKKAGDLTVPANKSITFRYRLIFHEGDEKQADIAGLYKAFATTRTKK